MAIKDSLKKVPHSNRLVHLYVPFSGGGTPMSSDRRIEMLSFFVDFKSGYHGLSFTRESGRGNVIGTNETLSMEEFPGTEETFGRTSVLGPNLLRHWCIKQSFPLACRSGEHISSMVLFKHSNKNKRDGPGFDAIRVCNDRASTIKLSHSQLTDESILGVHKSWSHVFIFKFDTLI
jgi:hypothetical protein